MKVMVDYDREQVEFDLPEGQVVGVWRGPAGLAPDAFAAAARGALNEPDGYPPVGRMVVPGDRVTLAVDPAAPGLDVVLRELTDSLLQGGVEAGDLTLIAPLAQPARDFWRPEGSTTVVHDPGDSSQMAYLASTNAGRRVYLNRRLIDADLVISIAGVRPALGGGAHGAARLIFPGLSNRESPDKTLTPPRRANQARKGEESIDESVEVSALLGSRFHVATVPAAQGELEVIAGRDDVVHNRSLAALRERWRFETEGRAELVVAGVGGTHGRATLEDLALALATAAELVDRGGRIIVISKAGGPIGPALGRLIQADLPRGGQEALRGLENEVDYQAALAIARATAWADVFLASTLDPQTVEDLDMTPLDRPEQARRLAAGAQSCILLSRAELTDSHARS